TRKIDDRIATMRDAAPRPAIHDTHHHRASIPLARHTHDSAEWQRPMRSVRLTLPECDTARSTAPLELVRVIRRLAVQHVEHAQILRDGIHRWCDRVRAVDECRCYLLRFIVRRRTGAA